MEFNNNLDGDTYRDAISIKSKSERELLIHKAKVSALERLIDKYNLVHTYRHNKNKDSDKAGFTFNPRRVTVNPLRIDYILTSDNLVNGTSSLEVEVA